MNRRQFVIGGIAASLIPSMVSAAPGERKELQWAVQIKG